MTAARPCRVLLVGNFDATHVGAHFRAAAADAGVEVLPCDVRRAFAGPAWRRRLAWWTGGRRPVGLGRFSDEVVRLAERMRPDLLLATGLAPLNREALDRMASLGIRLANFLTDDPWNPIHRAPWFLRALPRYEHVFSPRYANLDDLRRAGIPAVSYLPFAFAPGAHYPDPPADPAERARFDADVVFAGNADADRLPVARALVRAGLDVALYGGYWDRDPETRPAARGFLDAAGLRKAIGGARVSLGLVRRANRDGHSMRSFEVPAMAGCLLTEETEDHRRLYGGDDAVVFFRSEVDLVAGARLLLADAARRHRMREVVRQRVTGGPHRYADRLTTIVNALLAPTHENRARHTRPVSRV